MNIFKTYAEELIDHGLPIIPCDGKRALPGEWSKYCHQMPSDDQVEYWLKEYARMNIGLCLGPESGVIAFDVDVNDEKLVDMIKECIPESPVVRRGKKGWAAFYLYNGEKSESIKYQGFSIIDILSAGRQVIIPPSIHPDTNKPYTWDGGRTLWDYKDQLFELKPEWLSSLRDVLSGTESAIQLHAPPSGRNDKFKALVGGMYGSGRTLDYMVEFCKRMDKLWYPSNRFFTDKKEFKTEDEHINAIRFVSNIVESVGMFRASEGKPTDIKRERDLELSEKYPSSETGFFVVSDKGMKANYNEYAGYFIDKYKFISSDGENYVYNGTHYSQITRKALNRKCRTLTKKQAMPNTMRGFNDVLEADAYKSASDLKAMEQANTGLINLANGTLDVKKRELKPHTPDQFFKYKLNHHFDKSATCPRWLDHLNWLFMGDEILIESSAEIFGYCIQGGNPWLHKAFVLQGEGRNGKSTFLDILKEFIGRENTSHCPLDKLTEPFFVLGMDGKLANILDETPKTRVNSEAFKMAIGGSPMLASHKGVDVFTMDCNARFVFAGNSLPNFGDSSIGLLERMYFLPFPRYIENKERKREYHKRFLGELPGILNWALDGLDRLIDRGYIRESDRTAEMHEEFVDVTDSVHAWVKGNVERKDGVKKTVDDMYRLYRHSVTMDGSKPVCKLNFGKKFKKSAKRVFGLTEDEWPTVTFRGKKQRGYVGFTVLDDNRF